MAVAMGEKKDEMKQETEKEFRERTKKEIIEAIGKLPDREAAMKILGELDCKYAFRIMPMGKRSLKEALHLNKKADDELVDVMLRVKAIVEAYDNIDNYTKVKEALNGDKMAEGALMRMLGPSMKLDEKTESVIKLATEAEKLDKSVEESMRRLKEEAESYIELLRCNPAEINKLRNDVHKALRSEL